MNLNPTIGQRYSVTVPRNAKLPVEKPAIMPRYDFIVIAVSQDAKAFVVKDLSTGRHYHQSMFDLQSEWVLRAP